MSDENELEELRYELNELKNGPKYIKLRNNHESLSYIENLSFDNAVEALHETEMRLSILSLADESLIDKKFQKQILKKEFNSYICHLNHDKLKQFLQDHRVQIARVRDKLNNL